MGDQSKKYAMHPTFADYTNENRDEFAIQHLTV